MSSKFHGTGKGIGRSGASAVTSYLHGYNVGPGGYKAAGELIAKEAQKKIDERRAKREKEKAQPKEDKPFSAARAKRMK